VNCNVKLFDHQISGQEFVHLFKRPFMGGMDRHGVIGKGSPAEVDAEIRRVVASAPKQFILGADCTVEADTDWDRLRNAIAVAHRIGV
jgi:uroporphyrinogen decarboxylase